MTKDRKHTRAHRVQVIMDIFGSNRRLEKNQIVELVGKKLDEDFETEAFQRAIYRDLAELVHNNRLKVEYFTRDGALIEDYDPDVHKNVYCQWFVSGGEGEVSGSGILKNHNGLFHAPKILKDDFSILSGNSHTDPKHRQIYFQIGHSFLCIKVSFQAFPFSIIISRVHGAIEQRELDQIKKSLGIRACILKVPFPKLSSFKDSNKLGHFLIEFHNESSIAITDFNSSNGTYVYKIKPSDADKIRTSGAIMNDYTLTSTWVNVDMSFEKPMKVTNKTGFELPVLINAGNEFKLLVV